MSYLEFDTIEVIWNLADNCEEWDHVETKLDRLESHLYSLGFADSLVLVITCQSKKLEVADREPIIIYQGCNKAHEISRQTRTWWEKNCSEEAVACCKARERSQNTMKFDYR